MWVNRVTEVIGVIGVIWVYGVNWKDGVNEVNVANGDKRDELSKCGEVGE